MNQFSYPKLVLITFFCTSLLSGCQTNGLKNSERVTAIDRNESEVLTACLQDKFGQLLRSGRILYINRQYSIASITFHASSSEFSKSLLTQAAGNVPEDLILDFCAKNAEPMAVKRDTLELLTSQLSADSKSILICSNAPLTSVEEWRQFASNNPNAVGIITLSRVGFNKARDTAMLYMGIERGTLSGNGRIYVFRRQDAKWLETAVRFGPGWQK